MNRRHALQALGLVTAGTLLPKVAEAHVEPVAPPEEDLVKRVFSFSTRITPDDLDSWAEALVYRRGKYTNLSSPVTKTMTDAAQSVTRVPDIFTPGELLFKDASGKVLHASLVDVAKLLREGQCHIMLAVRRYVGKQPSMMDDVYSFSRRFDDGAAARIRTALEGIAQLDLTFYFYGPPHPDIRKTWVKTFPIGQGV